MVAFLMMSKEPVKTLTIGGSDSGGAAGIQADLKAWTALGVYGMSAITAVTAQNSLTVSAVQYMPAELVGAQVTAVLGDYGAKGIKTGFLGQVALINEVVRQLKAWPEVPLVVDPVLVNHRGEAMFPGEVVEAYRERLLPPATLITPNWREAALLAGVPAETMLQEEGQRTVVARLHTAGASAVLVTGLPQGKQIVDVWSDGRVWVTLAQPRLDTANTHGSGDTLSAAICAFLARGLELEQAIREAQRFTRWAIAGAVDWRMGGGHGPLALTRPWPTD